MDRDIHVCGSSEKDDKEPVVWQTVRLGIRFFLLSYYTKHAVFVIRFLNDIFFLLATVIFAKFTF